MFFVTNIRIRQSSGLCLAGVQLICLCPVIVGDVMMGRVLIVSRASSGKQQAANRTEKMTISTFYFIFTCFISSLF